ncbi:hypothetical protein Ddc_06051 [Ditylenchus destructor]|nr:hypothetical protein Ddc_06051 [Ditylenchus destructor]
MKNALTNLRRCMSFIQKLVIAGISTEIALLCGVNLAFAKTREDQTFRKRLDKEAPYFLNLYYKTENFFSQDKSYGDLVKEKDLLTWKQEAEKELAASGNLLKDKNLRDCVEEITAENEATSKEYDSSK